MKTRLLFATCALAAGSAIAAEPTVGGILSGAVFDKATKSVRAIVGVPGAAYLGGAILGGAENASVAPGGRRILLVKEDQLVLVTLTGGGAVETSLGAWSGSFDKVAWTDAAVAVAGAGSVKLFTFAGDGAATAPLAAFDNAVRALAIDADGNGVLAATAAGVFHITGGEAQLIASLGDPTALAISGANAYAADRARAEIVRIANYATAPEVQRLAGDVGEGVGLAVSADNKLLLVADAAGSRIQTIALASGEIVEQAALDFKPERVESMGAGLYRLDGRAQQQDPVEVASLTQGLRVFFIPAGSAEE